MPLFGAHMSIAGGYHNALLAAQAHGCDTIPPDHERCRHGRHHALAWRDR
jgi:hypothetical protein